MNTSGNQSILMQEASSSTPANVRPRKRQRVLDGVSTNSNTRGSHQCQVCYRSYERADHLHRHLDSHRNERSFRCEDCPAGFNRRDLLLRHQATHEKNAAHGQVGPDRTAERAVKACDACVVSKVKCDNTRPCQRCRKKDIQCTTKSFGPRLSSPVSLTGDENTASVFSTPSKAQSPSRADYDSTVEINHCAEAAHFTSAPEAQALLDLYNNGHTQGSSIPTFFEQIMVPEPEFISMEPMQPPPDLSTWMPDVDWFGQVDLFSIDFMPTVDQTFEAQEVLDEFFIGPEPRNIVLMEASENTSSYDAARRRHAIFQRSPWLWIPGHNQHTFSEDDSIMIDERNVDLTASPHEPSAANITIPDRLSPQARDRIFQLVSKTAQSQISILSFPSAECLDKLIKVGIAKRTETDAWIHPYTFDSERARPEFLTALVAAGCVCFGIPSVSRTGLVLQEIVRVALSRLTEHDNSTIRDLQYLQASMLWLDIGAFCGFRRKMEIAESSLQPLVTALRRAGKLDKVTFSSIVPNADDSEEDLDRKWRNWVEQESYKRLAHHLFEHDIKMTMVKHRNPLISYSELTLGIPASRSLWLAPTAEVWRTRWLTSGSQTHVMSLRTLLQNDSAIRCLPSNYDTQVSRSAYLHGIAAQIWELSQQHVLMHDSSDASSQLWLHSRQQKLDQCLRYSDFSLDNSPAISCVLHQFLQMYLHVNLDTITRFAGKCGEEEAHRAYTHLQPWSQGKDARSALYHAGQLFRATRAIPRYQIRGSDAFMIYHAVMVVWTYSMMTRDREKKTGTNTPVPRANSAVLRQGHHGPPHRDNTTVFLDDPPSANQSDIEAFILMNAGNPCLHIIPHQVRSEHLRHEDRLESCNLKSPSQVMKVGVKLLEETHPDVDRDNSPPLLKALCGLMEELGGLR